MQTSYGIDQPQAVAGLLSNLNPHRTATFSNPIDKAYFGQFVAREGAATCKHPAASSDVILGVVVRALASEGAPADDDGLAAKSAVGVLHDGEIWVKTEEAIAVGDTPYIVYSGKKQVQTFVLDGDLVTSNVISVEVNGTLVTHTFASDHNASIAAFAAKIALVNGVSSAVAGGSGNRTVTITSDFDTDIALTEEDIEGGSSQAAITITETVAALPTTNRGQLRNDGDSSRALDASGYVTILGYNAELMLARVRVAVKA